MICVTFLVFALSSFVVKIAVKQNTLDLTLKYSHSPDANKLFYVDDGLTGAESCYKNM